MTNKIITGIEDDMDVVCYTYQEAVTYARIMLGVGRASIFKRSSGYSIGSSPLVGDVRFYRTDLGMWSVYLKTEVIETAPVVIVEPVIAEDVPVIEDEPVIEAAVIEAAADNDNEIAEGVATYDAPIRNFKKGDRVLALDKWLATVIEDTDVFVHRFEDGYTSVIPHYTLRLDITGETPAGVDENRIEHINE